MPVVESSIELWKYEHTYKFSSGLPFPCYYPPVQLFHPLPWLLSLAGAKLEPDVKRRIPVINNQLALWLNGWLLLLCRVSLIYPPPHDHSSSWPIIIIDSPCWLRVCALINLSCTILQFTHLPTCLVTGRRKGRRISPSCPGSLPDAFPPRSITKISIYSLTIKII